MLGLIVVKHWQTEIGNFIKKYSIRSNGVRPLEFTRMANLFHKINDIWNLKIATAPTKSNIGYDRYSVLYSGVLLPHPARVTRLHHGWGANEAEILFQISALVGVWTPDLAV